MFFSLCFIDCFNLWVKVQLLETSHLSFKTFLFACHFRCLLSFRQKFIKFSVIQYFAFLDLHIR